MSEIDKDYEFETNSIEQHLRDHPEVVDEFYEAYLPLILQIQSTFNEMLKAGDLSARVLFCSALFEILRHVQQEQKEFIDAERSRRGYFDIKDAWSAYTGEC